MRPFSVFKITTIGFALSFLFCVLPLAAQRPGSADTGRDGGTSSGLRPTADTDGATGEVSRFELSPNPVGRGDRFTCTIIVPTEETGNLEVEEPDLPDAFSRIGGPYIRPIYEISDTGERVKNSRIRYVYVSSESGRFELGSYRMRVEDTVFETQPRLMEIGVYRNRNLIVPPDMSWNIDKDTAYVGENLIWILEVEGLTDIRIFERVRVDSPAEGFFEPVDGIGSIVRYTLGGATLYREPVSEYIYTPSTPGDVRLPRAEIDTSGIRISSDRPTVEVLPLPDEVEEHGIVGKFSLTSEVDKEEIRIGESVEYRLHIEGTGNLNYLRLPDPELEGWIVVDEEVEESFESSKGGYTGSREKIYTLTSDEAGEKRIRLSTFSALNPETGSAYSLGGGSHSVLVQSAERGDGEGEAGGDFPFSPLEITRAVEELSVHDYTQATQYLWLLPGPLVLLFFIFFRRKKWGILFGSVLLISFSAASLTVSSSAEEGMRAYRAGEWDRAYSSFRTVLEEYEYCPEGAYNAALSAQRLGRTGEAFFLARSAAYSDPSKGVFRDFLSYIEEKEKVPQHDLFPWPVHPDLFFLILTLALNFAALMAVVYLFTRHNGFFILSVLLLIFAVASLPALGFSAHSRSTDVAVAVGGEVTVKTIPKNTAEQTFKLEEGQSVRIIGKVEPFFFVRTVLGRQGWVREERLCIVGAPYEEAFTKIDVARSEYGLRRDTGGVGEEEKEGKHKEESGKDGGE